MINILFEDLETLDGKTFNGWFEWNREQEVEITFDFSKSKDLHSAFQKYLYVLNIVKENETFFFEYGLEKILNEQDEQDEGGTGVDIDYTEIIGIEFDENGNFSIGYFIPLIGALLLKFSESGELIDSLLDFR